MFLQNILATGTQVAVLAILIVVGFICCKCGLFTQNTARGCNALLFYIVTPCVICRSFQSLHFDKSTLNTLLATFVCAIVFHILAIVIVGCLFRHSEDNCIYRFAAMYGNIGYMGLPLSEAVLGQTGVFMCSVMVVVFNVFCFTHGALLMTKGSRSVNLKNILINPGTIGIAMGLPLYLTGFQLPQIINTPITHLASLNTPLAMVMFGTYLAGTKLSGALKNKDIYITLFVKLVFFPAVTLLLCKAAHITGSLLTACMILACVPSANNTVMFAAQFQRDTGKASVITALCILISILTMPVWIAAAQSF